MDPAWYEFHGGSRLYTLGAVFISQCKGKLWCKKTYETIPKYIEQREDIFLIAMKCPNNCSRMTGKKTTVVITSDKWEAWSNTVEYAYAWRENQPNTVCDKGYNQWNEFEYYIEKL